MSYQTTAQPVKGSRRKGLLVLGLVLLVGGIGAGVALFAASGSQYDEAVKNLQRAPVGCDTEFDFTGTGRFVFYTETKGTVGDIRGDCENTDTDYDHGDGRVRVSLSLADEDGNDVDLDRENGISYDAAGFVGTAVRSVTIDEPGQYVLSVDSDDTDFAIAVGRNPKEDADSLKTTAIIVAAAGLVLGLVFVLLGLRRRPTPAGPAGTDFSGFGGGPGLPGSPTTPYTTSPYPTSPYPTTPYPQPNIQPGGPPLVAPPQHPLPPATYPQRPSPPNSPPDPGPWGSPTS